MSELDNNYLEAIPNTSAGTYDGTHRNLARTTARHLRKFKCTATLSGNFTEYLQGGKNDAKTTRANAMEGLTKEFNGKIQSIKFSLDKNDEVIASENTEAISRHWALWSLSQPLLGSSRKASPVGRSVA